MRELAAARPARSGPAGAQDAYLFSATIADNVRVGRHGASDAEVVAALADAGLGEWIRSLPDGIATPVGSGGAEVSGGQRQRIALARVLLSGARFLIVDEPTAHLDPAGGRAFLEHLATLPGDRAVLVITHERSGLERFDELLVLAGGRVQPR